MSPRPIRRQRPSTCSKQAGLSPTDYFGGLAVGYRCGEDGYELYLFHESSHLGDELLDQGRAERIDFSREAARLLWAREWDAWRVYAGPTLNLRATPSEIGQTFVLQAGVERRFLLGGQDLYAALDLQSRQANDWQLSVTGQVGWFLAPPGRSRLRPRLFLELFPGNSNMGQFWEEDETYVMLGLAASL